MDKELEAFFIEDHGEDIKATDFWKSKLEKQGELVFSPRGSTLRVLVPGSDSNVVAMAKRSMEIIISRGPLEDREGEGYEVLFHTGRGLENDSFRIYYENCFLDLLSDSLIGKDLKCDFWVESNGLPVKAVSRPAKYREVETLPWLKPWSEKDNLEE